MTGCVGRDKEEYLASPTGAFAPLPPIFFTGPAVLLLTNAASYSARVSLSSDSPAQPRVSGQLLAQADRLLFAPDPVKESKKTVRGDFSFIWNVTKGSGYVLSEALQGYAPVSISILPTNLSLGPISGSLQTIEERVCQEQYAVIEMSDNSRAGLRFCRALDLNLALSISTVSNTQPFMLALSKVRLESLSPELFVPPKGFTPYSSAEAMITELILRQHNLRRSPSGPFERSYRDRR